MFGLGRGVSRVGKERCKRGRGVRCGGVSRRDVVTVGNRGVGLEVWR